jgi:integral membrane protein
MAAEHTLSQALDTARGIPAALARYRVMAYFVGVLLIVLTLVAMPLKYFADIPEPVTVVGIAHGFLYAVFFLVTLDLAVRARWRPLGALVVVLAGTVPFLSFVAERKVTARMRAGQRV